MISEAMQASETETAEKLLDVRHLSVDYLASNGTVHAVKDVSFTLRRGEILGLAGESGSGKSTLAYAITRLLRPPAVITEGEILYYPQPNRSQSMTFSRLPGLRRHGKKLSANGDTADGEGCIDLLELSPSQLRAMRWNDLAIVFQSAMNALNPVLNIGSQILDVLRTHRPEMGADSRKRRAVELLQLVGIAPDRLRSYPHELSGGMRQRAIIAIALALSPEVLIMDEPTTALDVVVQRDILTEIMRLREKLGFSVIFITHDLSLLLELADKVAIMYAGRIVEQASQRDLYQRPCHPYSYGLLHSFPSLHGPRQRMSGISGSPPDLRAVPPGCAFHPRCPLAFEPCDSELPVLRPALAENPQQVVACHLYDPRFSSQPPAQDDLANTYASLAERSARS